MVTETAIYKRYILEPRCSYGARGNSNNCWLVVYDTVAGGYLNEGAHHRYLKFKNSKEAFEFLNSLKDVSL